MALVVTLALTDHFKTASSHAAFFAGGLGADLRGGRSLTRGSTPHSARRKGDALLTAPPGAVTLSVVGCHWREHAPNHPGLALEREERSRIRSREPAQCLT